MSGKCFVIGGNHHNTLGVIRSLGERKVRSCVVIQSEENVPYVSRSKYIQKCWIVKTEEEVLSTLRKEAALFNGEKAVLIVCSDNLSSLVDLNHDELNHWYHLPGAEEQARITNLMNKEVMSELARKIGFDVPHSLAVNTRDDNSIALPLPWIIKPLVSKDGKKADIQRIYSRQEWEDYCKIHNASVQIQQLIEKEYEYQLIGLSLNGGDEVIIPGLSYVIRPAATTNTGFLHYIALDDTYNAVLDKGKRFLKAIGYSGLFSLEFIRGKDETDYFLEINFRNDGNAICVTASGVNLPYIWYLFNTGSDYHSELQSSKMRPVYVMPEFTDLNHIAQGRLKVTTWIRDLFRTDRFMEFDRRDRAPFNQLFCSYCKRCFRKLIKKHH